MKILYKFPTRERPDKCFAAIDNIISLARHDNYQIVLTLDIDDTAMYNQDVIEKIKTYGSKVTHYFGTSTGKISAINRDLGLLGEYDILCLHSDDMWFTKEGFDLDIIEAFKDFSGLVHFPDGHANERLCTYPMMDKKYYNKFGYIYHPDYISVYSDNEQHQVATLLNQYKYVDKKILIHKHPIWGYGVKDGLLEKTENPVIYKQDMETFNRRKENNFYI